MARTVLEVVMAADPRSLERGFQRGTKAADKFGKDVDKSTKKVHVGLAGIGSAAKLAGGAFATAGLVSGIKDFAKASADSEASSARMQAQLKASGVSYRAHAKEIDGVIQRTSKLAALDDEDLQDAFSNIVRSTGSVSKGLKGIGLAADIATAKHIDVAKAGVLVGKVATGNVSALSRYGIQIDKNATSTQALAALQQKFGGQAKAFGETSAGAYARFQVSSDNLKESIGGALAPALASAANKFAALATAVDRNPEQFKNAAIASAGLVTAIGGILIAAKVASAVSTLRTAVVGMNAAMAANPIGLVVVGLAALSAGLYLAYKRSETFRNAVNTSFAAVQAAARGALPTVMSVLRNVQNAFAGVATAVRGMVTVVRALIHGDFAEAWGGAKTIVSGALTAIVGALKAYTAPARAAASLVGKGVVGGLREGAEGAGNVVSTIANSVRARLGDLTSFFVRVGKSIISAIAQGIRSAPGAIGDALKSVGGGLLDKLNITGRARGGMFAATGGIANRPMLLAGEEAPRYPEYVIPTNPAYRGRAQQLVKAAAMNVNAYAAGGVIGPAAVGRMQAWANGWASKGVPYDYGGGHGALGRPGPHGGFDCSGYVSGILGVGGVIGSPMAVRSPLQQALVPGPGKFVTVGIRGSSGKNAHTMIKVGNAYYESGGGGNGAHKRSGWNGAFDLFHPANEAQGDGNTSAGANGRAMTKSTTSGAVGAIGRAGIGVGSFGAVGATAGSPGFASTGGGGGIAYSAAGDGGAADAGPTRIDYLNAAAAEAGLTAGTADDITAQQQIVDFLSGELDTARASGDPRRVVEAASNLKSAIDSLKSLKDAVDNAAAQQAAMTEAMTQLAAETKRANDMAASEIGIQNSQLVKSLADLLSGQIVGKGLQPRSQTAGAGKVASY